MEGNNYVSYQAPLQNHKFRFFECFFFFNFCQRLTEIFWGKTILFFPLFGPSLSLVISPVQYDIIIKDSLVRPDWCHVNEFCYILWRLERTTHSTRLVLVSLKITRQGCFKEESERNLTVQSHKRATLS